MYGDDTTIYYIILYIIYHCVIGLASDMVATSLKLILGKIATWCRNNLLAPHPGKTEFMLMQRGTFVGPLQAIKLGDTIINQVVSSRCMAVLLSGVSKSPSRVNHLHRS